MSGYHKVCTYCGYVGTAEFQFSKLKSVKCPKCRHAAMVALRSEAGQRVITHCMGQPRTWADFNELVSK